MKTFREFITERFKSEHEPLIRKVVSDARREYFFKPNRFSRYGDCDMVAHYVARKLQDHYPSAKVVMSKNPKLSIPDSHPSDGLTGHAWVEIPEIKHFVDPTHDMFHATPRENVPQKNGLFSDNVVKIGHTGSRFYKRVYTGKHDHPQKYHNLKPEDHDEFS